jgi:predicted HAD superfamily Cof-like phosphohydrolase
MSEPSASDMVREFHVAFGLPINDATRTLNKLRADLIREEAGETAEAVESGDLEHMAKELADLAYVVHGAALTLGIDLDRAVAEVHRSNMSKLVDGKPVMRPDGKVLKGSNYQPPDMSGALINPAVEGGVPTP